MKKTKKTEREYVEYFIRLKRDGVLRTMFSRAFGVGVIYSLLLLLMAGGAFLGYLRLGGSKEDWHFLFGLAIGTLLCPSIFILGISLARTMSNIESQESRPFTLMVKYHDHLVRSGLNPYEDPIL